MANKKFICLALLFLLINAGTAAQASIQNDALIIPPRQGYPYRSEASYTAPSQNFFYYQRTFGKLNEAYPDDPQHQYLNTPFGIDVDVNGNVWVAESNGNFIAKYAPDGTLLLSIGTPGTQSIADENHFVYSLEVAVDSSGNPWVVDSGSNRVVKFDPLGNYLTDLGQPGQSGTGNYQFNHPTGIAFDSTGNIYISDTDNHRIQVFNHNGVFVKTIGVTGGVGMDNNHFNTPHHIHIDENDYLFVTDTTNHRVQIFDENHEYVTTLGVSGVAGTDNSHLTYPKGVTANSSNIYVVDSGYHRIQIFDRATFSYKSTLGRQPGDYSFDWPADAAVDQAGNIYVADTFNHRIQKFNSSLVFQKTFGVSDIPYLSDGYHFNGPFDVAVDGDGNIAIVEGWWYGHRLIVLEPNGTPKFIIGEPGVPGSDNTHLNDPNGVAFDTNGKIYVGDCWNHRIQIFSNSGTYLSTLGTGYGQGNYQFNCPAGLSFDRHGNLYVADSFNHRVQVFDNNLAYLKTLGVTGEDGSNNSHFNWPRDVAVDLAGNIYVADTFNHRLQKFNNNYVWQMTLGVSGECGFDSTHFCEPMGVAVDASGKIYASQKFGERVQIFDSSGAYLTTIGGSWGFGNGQLRAPGGVEVDNTGSVYIADLDNHRVQKFGPGKLTFLPFSGRNYP